MDDPEALQNEMLHRRYFRVTFDCTSNAVFERQCYIALKNGNKPPDFGALLYMYGYG